MAGLATGTVRSFETGQVRTKPEHIDAIRDLLTNKGIGFLPTNTPGRHPRVRQLFFEDGSGVELTYDD